MTEILRNKVPVIAFVGRSGCGKTTLLEGVLPHLVKRGIRPAVVKHTQHKNISADVEGTDTRRMWDAGAHSVALVTPDSVVHWQRSEREPELAEVLSTITGVDIIILEGFKSSSVPKIEVLRREHHPVPLDNLESRLAFVTDVPDLVTALPRFKLNDYASISNFLCQWISDYLP
jgi:molybdopterin-guanine dinucleotide biosynthesis protein MobB